MPQPPPWSALTYKQISPVIREEEEEYIVDSRSEHDVDDGGKVPPLARSDEETEYVS